MSQPKLQPYKDKAGEFRWRRIAANGNIIAESGEGYVNEQNMLEMARGQFPEDEFDWSLLANPDQLNLDDEPAA